jgi:hypothetical protein
LTANSPGVLEFDDTEGQAVDEGHDIGSALRLVLDHRVLVDRQPIIGIGIVEVDKAHVIAFDYPIIAVKLDRNPLDQKAMLATIFLDVAFGSGTLGFSLILTLRTASCFRAPLRSTIPRISQA